MRPSHASTGLYRTGWREVIDRLWQRLRELLRKILRLHADLGRKSRDYVRGERGMHLIGRYRLTGASPDPGLHRVAQPLALHLRHDALHAAVHR
jgi:hypothetical protein